MLAELVVMARARALEGKEAEVEKAYHEAVIATHAEAGCIRYALHRVQDDPRTFVMLERWTSREALDLHLASPHIQKLFAKLKELVEGPSEILLLDPLSDDSGAKGKL